MFRTRARKIIALCALLYLGYLGVLIGLKFFYSGDFEIYLQAALVYVTLTVVAFLDRKFKFI